MAASQMVLRCGKTGLLFFDQKAATEHAEALGAAYANFEEVALDSKVWWCVETGRHADSEAKMNQIKSRDKDSVTWEEKDIAFLFEQQKKKEKAAERKNKFYDSVDQKKLQVLTEVKAHGRNRSAKALHFTRASNTIEAAEAWITEHAEDADIDKLDDAWLDENAAGCADVAMGDEDVVMATEEPDTRQKGDPNPEEVKTAVNQELLKQLMEMGFAEVPAEKALYLRDNNLEHAIAWLGDQNQEDDEYEKPLKPKPKVPEKPKMSKEEAEAKALEMQKRLRQKRAEEEKISEKDKERMRIESTKMMVEANEKLKEEERKRAFEQLRIEKEAHERHRAELKEQLRLDYINRFGCEPPPEEEEKEKAIKDKPLREQVIHWLGKLKKTYKDTNKEGLKTCLTTLKIYGTNLKDNPAEPKFKTLKVDNKAFQNRIAPFEGAMEILDCIGFENQGEVLVQRSGVPDGFLIGELIKFADIMLGQL